MKKWDEEAEKQNSVEWDERWRIEWNGADLKCLYKQNKLMETSSELAAS